MNDIPRGTSRAKLARFLLAQSSSPAGPLQQQPQVVFGSDISDSRLDDELSVAILEFSDTPAWLLSQDPSGFPKFTLLGTIWRGVDRHATDTNGRSEFIRAVINSATRLGLQYAEMIAEFADTDVNVQDEQGRTALHWACVELLPDMVRLCLSVPDCATGLRDNDGLTAFDIALRRGDDFLPSLFYSSMLEIEQASPQVALLRILTLSSDETRFENIPLFPGEALFQPVGERNTSLVVALLDRGVVLTTKDEDGNTALHIAAGQVDNVDIVTRLIKAGSDINAIGHRGSTPLHNAVRTADAEMVKLLVNYQANISITDEDAMSALHLAAENGQVDIARVLLEGGADVGARDGLGRTVVEVAKANREVQVVELRNTIVKLHQPVPPDTSSALQDVAAARPFKPETQVRNPTDKEDLIFAAWRGDLDAVRALLSQGADVAAVDYHSCTALHRAARGGHTEIIECLLAHGANIEASVKCGITALHHAVLCERTNSVEALLAGGAQTEALILQGLMVPAPSARSSVGGEKLWLEQGQTSLHLAVRYGGAVIVKILLAAGAQLEVKDRCQQSPLHVATRFGRPEIVSMLLIAGASIEVEDIYGDRPLHNAVLKGHTEVVQILLSGGAETEARNANRKTAYQLALRAGHMDVVKLVGEHTTAIARLRSDVRYRFKRDK